MFLQWFSILRLFRYCNKSKSKLGTYLQLKQQNLLKFSKEITNPMEKKKYENKLFK